jgi:hypothetical protein
LGTLKDNGLNEDTTYLRIRPVEREGKVKLRADTKAKEGTGKFSTRATWEAPPLVPRGKEEGKGPPEAHLGLSEELSL